MIRSMQPFTRLTLTRDNVAVTIVTTIITISVLSFGMQGNWLTGATDRTATTQEQAAEARGSSPHPDMSEQAGQAAALTPPAAAAATPASTATDRAKPGSGKLSGLDARGGPGRVVVSWQLSDASPTQIQTTITGNDGSHPAGSCQPATTGCTITGLTNGREYAVTVALTHGSQVITHQTVRATPYPSVLSNRSTRLWFDAADPAALVTAGQQVSGATVRRVLDHSSSGADAGPVDGYTPPTLTTINGHKALRFGPNGGLRFPASSLPSGSAPSTVYAVAAMDSNTSSTDCFSHVLLWGTANTNGDRALIKGCGNALAYADTYDTWIKASPALPWKTGQVQIMRGDFTADTLAVWMDGASSYTWSQPENSHMETGSRPDGILGGTPWDVRGSWQGRIAEVIVLSHVPTSAENAMIMQYLQRKWGL
jgi:hypothetical protein